MVDDKRNGLLNFHKRLWTLWYYVFTGGKTRIRLPSVVRQSIEGKVAKNWVKE